MEHRIIELEKFAAKQEEKNKNSESLFEKLHATIDVNTQALNTLNERLLQRSAVEQFILWCLGSLTAIIAVVKGVPDVFSAFFNIK